MGRRTLLGEAMPQVRPRSGVPVSAVVCISTATVMSSNEVSRSAFSLLPQLRMQSTSTTCMIGRELSLASARSGGGIHPTRLLRRPQTIKPNPNEATSGQFEKSFEKMTDKIESRLPFRQHHVLHGNIYELQYGDRSEHDMWVEAQEDLYGREKEKPAARQVRSYFSDEDLSPEALRVRSPQLKVAQNLQRPAYDKKILKTTAESAAYYYTEMTVEEKQLRRWKIIGGWCIVGMVTLTGLCRLAENMRTAG